MKLLKALVVIFALIGCLAVSGIGFFIYSKIKSGTFQFKNPIVMTGNNKAAQTTAPLTSSNPDNDAILRAYQKPVATPIQVSAVGNSTGTMVAVSNPAGVASSTPAKVPTPGPDLKMIREWPTGRKWVALTFDDGPHPEWTPKFVELLKSKNVKATFFLIGPNIQTHGDIAKSIASAGFEIGNHTMTHPQFSKASADKITQELTQTNEIIKNVIGLPDVYLMRPPYGMAPTNVQKVCAELGLHIICWNIDTNDWNKKTTEQEMFDNVMKNVRDGSIILMHDRAEKSYNTTAKIIDLIQQKGYEFVTVGELLGYKPYVRGGLSALAASVAPAPMESGGAPPPVTISVPAPAPAVTVVPAAPAGAAPGTALDGTPAVTVSPSLVTAPPPRR